MARRNSRELGWRQIQEVASAAVRWRALASAARFPQRREPAYLAVFDPGLIGQVRANVTEVSVRLSDGDAVRLRPAQAYGRHWIGLLLPDGVSIDLVTAYANGVELAHSTPLHNSIAYGFLSWLPPGDAGPAPTTKIVNAAVVPGDQLSIGPSGTCIGWPDAMSCWRVADWFADYPATAGSSRALVVSVAPEASYLVLTLSAGRNFRVPVVKGAGVRRLRGVQGALRVSHPALGRVRLGRTATGGRSGRPERLHTFAR